MPQTTLTRKQSVAIAAAMTALSHPRRVALFTILEDAGPPGLGFDELLKRSKLSISTLRHHLRPMQAAGLVVRRRKGVNVVFRLHGQAVRRSADLVVQRLAAIPPSPRGGLSPPPLN